MLDDQIKALETAYPNREWLLRLFEESRPSGGVLEGNYFASSIPKGYIIRMGLPNPCIVKVRASTPSEALDKLFHAVAAYILQTGEV